MLKPSRRFWLLQFALLSSAIATTATLVISVGRPVRAELQDSPKALVDEVWQFVNSNYVDTTFNSVDWQATRQRLLSKNYTSKKQAYTAIQEAFKQLGDPYTLFFDPEEYRVEIDSFKGQLSGAIGISVKQNEKTEQLTVKGTQPNSPAGKAGMKTGDQIVAIDGKPTKGMKVDDAPKLIGGKVGTAVTLQIKRQQKIFNLKLTRANVELLTVSYNLKQEGAKRIGYIRLREFSPTSPRQMRQAIASLNSKRVNGFVLDLRNNPGGQRVAAVEIAQMWIDNGVIVREVTRGGSEISYANRMALTKQPLVVLVDGNSASASELLAGALKDNNRAVIVGSQTLGKASSQAIRGLSDGSGMTVTTGHYFTPNGTDIDHKGITPNVRIDLTSSQYKQLATKPTLIGTKSDPQYRRAIAVLTSNSFPTYSPSPASGKSDRN